ncbi:hypothetical protein PR202_gb02036 [Eleusine coracana subsp. coracana]|uniref:Uncharacterized protein n=1 Tax=Eleusine coracana subsp. coracana TaxID=191504 RepID=A0AAV5DXV7_ELECO|nr:hypothetical protein PR202_gb02036 [Eleusine coracana subsp. coracana]
MASHRRTRGPLSSFLRTWPRRVSLPPLAFPCSSPSVSILYAFLPSPTHHEPDASFLRIYCLRRGLHPALPSHGAAWVEVAVIGMGETGGAEGAVAARVSLNYLWMARWAKESSSTEPQNDTRCNRLEDLNMGTGTNGSEILTSEFTKSTVAARLMVGVNRGIASVQQSHRPSSNTRGLVHDAYEELGPKNYEHGDESFKRRIEQKAVNLHAKAVVSETYSLRKLSEVPLDFQKLGSSDIQSSDWNHFPMFEINRKINNILNPKQSKENDSSDCETDEQHTSHYVANSKDELPFESRGGKFHFSGNDKDQSDDYIYSNDAKTERLSTPSTRRDADNKGNESHNVNEHHDVFSKDAIASKQSCVPATGTTNLDLMLFQMSRMRNPISVGVVQPPVSAQPSDRWLKRLYLGVLDPEIPSSKRPKVGGEDSREDASCLFGMGLGCNRAGNEESSDHVKEDKVSGEGIKLHGNDQKLHVPAKSLNYWIGRWCEGGTPVFHGHPGHRRQATKLDQASEESGGQFPSIAAMAMMGRVMNKLRPCDHQKKGPFVVWKTE